MATAQGILSVVTANMAKAIRVISVQRGHDPRDYTLMAFGGAGPLHAARLAKELEMKRVLVPRNPGILCAMGLLLTDLRADFASTRLTPLAAGLAPMTEAFAGLAGQAEAWFAQEHIAPEAPATAPHASTCATPARTTSWRSRCRPATSARRPWRRSRKASPPRTIALYGFIAEEEPVQLVTFRVEATGTVQKAVLRPRPLAGPDASAAIAGERALWLPETGGIATVPVYDRERLLPGNRSPARPSSSRWTRTTVVLPGMTARVDAYLNLILEAA